MALWGNRDSKSATGTVAIDSAGIVTGTDTLFTTEAKIGNTITVNGIGYVIVTITSDTVAKVTSAIAGGAITVVGSTTSYRLSEKPAGLSDNSNIVFGVDGPNNNGENYASAGRVVAVGIANPGTGYTEVPGVVFSGGGGSSAAATATVSGGSITAITLTNNGSSYEDVPTVNIDIPFRSIPTTAVNTTTDVITYTAHGMPTGEQITYRDGGGAAMLEADGAYYAIRINDNTFKVADSAANANAGTAINLTGTGNDDQYFDLTGAVTATAVAALGGGYEDQESQSNITHTGWVKRTVGTGGRAGRVQYETLVAMGSITGDALDDRQFPDD